MSDERTVHVSFDQQTMDMLRTCAAWRKVSMEQLVRAYVEDWLDVDYPESQGRLTRRGTYRDDPITLDAQARQEVSSNWRDDLGISRPRPEWGRSS